LCGGVAGWAPAGGGAGGRAVGRRRSSSSGAAQAGKNAAQRVLRSCCCCTHLEPDPEGPHALAARVARLRHAAAIELNAQPLLLAVGLVV
jgi:hypothetical protein